MFFVKLLQNRHPERSALQIDRVTQRLWRGVEGPRRCLVYPRSSMLFNHRARTGRARHDLTLEPRTKNLLASFMSGRYIYILGWKTITRVHEKIYP
jgi:hypothetical protein